MRSIVCALARASLQSPESSDLLFYSLTMLSASDRFIFKQVFFVLNDILKSQLSIAIKSRHFSASNGIFFAHRNVYEQMRVQTSFLVKKIINFVFKRRNLLQRWVCVRAGGIEFILLPSRTVFEYRNSFVCVCVCVCV